MNRGYFCVWRKIEDSAVFQNEGLLKVFLWCLIHANHKESFVQVKTGRGFTEVKLKPGSFLFGRESAAKSLHMAPSTVWKRILKLKKLEILNIESNSHYSILYIINWHSYQDTPKKRNIEGNRQGTGKEHRQSLNHSRNKITLCDFSSQISELEKRYLDQEIINQAFQAVSSTRKGGKITDSVKLSILKSWDEYPVESVMAGIRAYLKKGYARQGKNEKYLLGIIRNHKPEDKESFSGPVMPNTGSHALNEHYRNQGYTIT